MMFTFNTIHLCIQQWNHNSSSYSFIHSFISLHRRSKKLSFKVKSLSFHRMKRGRLSWWGIKESEWERKARVDNNTQLTKQPFNIVHIQITFIFQTLWLVVVWCFIIYLNLKEEKKRVLKVRSSCVCLHKNHLKESVWGLDSKDIIKKISYASSFQTSTTHNTQWRERRKRKII